MSVSSKDKAPQPITGEDFERALVRAEVLLDSCDRGHARTPTLLAVAVLLATLVVSAIVIVVGLVISGGSPALWGTPIVAALGIAAWASWELERSSRRTMQRDERSMVEMIDILRELLADVSEREGWSPARYHLTRARIARFPIGGRRTDRRVWVRSVLALASRRRAAR